MTQAHSPYGGSAASRYMKCPGSIALSEHAPPDHGSAYAEEGTFAHTLAEECLLAGQRDATIRIGSQVSIETASGRSAKTVDGDMARAVNVYLEAVWDEWNEDEASEIEVEQRFSLPVDAADEGEVFGTNDALVYRPAAQKLTIFDYKHGAGVIVEVEDNIQLKFYAMGALQAHPEWPVREIELVIVQPRAFNAGEERGVKRWSLPMVETIEFPYELNEAITACKQPDAPLIPGDHCRFCPASTLCSAREQQFIIAANKDLAGVTLPEFADAIEDSGTPSYDVEQMGQVIAAYDTLGPWINDLRAAIDQHLLSGGHVPGWKVVEAVSRRKWQASDEEIAGHLQLFWDIPDELVRPRSLVTITEAKRLLKSHVPKEQYKQAEDDLTLRFTIKESKGLVTAPESDRRGAIQPVAAEFGSVKLGTIEGNDS
jgi:hypothetical protein